jgi:pimeloyl-ACP methyl ester carboxylesterase
MPTLHVNGATLHYEERGSGTPIIVIHGVWMSSRFFAHQLEGLSGEFRVIALDLRGHGQSEHVQHGHTVAQYARDLRAAMEQLGLTDVVLAGWSMGAFVIWEYLKAFGNQDLKGTIIIDESASDFKWPDWPYGFADLAALSHLISAIQLDQAGFVRGFIPAMFKNAPSDADAQWMLEEITRVPAAIASTILFDQTVQDYRPLLGSITIPTLLTFGRDEKLIPVAAAEHLAEQIAGAQLVMFEESSHCPFLEEPARFNQVVADFVKGL